MILIELFLSFLQIGAFSVGGGYAAIPLIREQTVTLHGWLTDSQFMDLATIAEMTPGPIVINGATFAGLQVAGIPGALSATLGAVLPSLILVSLLAWVYRKYRELPMLQSVLGSLRPAVVALISAAGINMLLQTLYGTSAWNAIRWDAPQWAGAALTAAAFFALRRLKWGPIPVMALCGAAGLALSLMGLF